MNNTEHVRFYQGLVEQAQVNAQRNYEESVLSYEHPIPPDRLEPANQIVFRVPQEQEPTKKH